MENKGSSFSYLSLLILFQAPIDILRKVRLHYKRTDRRQTHTYKIKQEVIYFVWQGNIPLMYFIPCPERKDKCRKFQSKVPYKCRKFRTKVIVFKNKQ